MNLENVLSEERLDIKDWISSTFLSNIRWTYKKNMELIALVLALIVNDDFAGICWNSWLLS